MLVKIWKERHTLLQREILLALISVYSLKWLHIFSANKFHPKLPQPSVKRTASDCRRPQYLLSWSVEVSSYHSIVEVQHVVRSTTTTPNIKSLWGVLNSDKGDIPIQIHPSNVYSGFRKCMTPNYTPTHAITFREESSQNCYRST